MRRMILPIIKKYWKLLLSVLIVSALGCGIMVGLSGAYLSLERSLDGYVEDYRYPSAVITTDVVNIIRLEDLLKIPGVTEGDARLCGDTVMADTRGRYLSVRVFSYAENEKQLFHTWEAADVSGRDSVMLEYNFAVDNGIHAGDEVAFRVGEEFRTYVIESLVSAPETLSVQITDDSWGANTDFGFAYAPIRLLEQESEREREKAKQELDERGTDLENAEKDADDAFEDTRKQLEDAKALLDEKDALFAEASEEAEDRKNQLLETARQLRATRAKLEKNIRDLNDARPQLEAGKTQLEDAIEQLRQARSALAQIDTALAELNEQYARLTEPKVVYAMQLMHRVPPETELSTLYEVIAELDQLIEIARLSGYDIDEDAPLSELVDELLLYVQQAEEDYEYLTSEEVLELIRRAENGEDISGDPEYSHLVEVISRYDSSFVPGGNIVAGYYTALAAVTSVHGEVESGSIRFALLFLRFFGQDVSLNQLRAAVVQLRQLVTVLEGATGRQINTVGELISAYEYARSQLENNIAELNAQRAGIIAELNKQGISEAEIPAKITELQGQLDSVNAQLAAMPGALQQLNDGIADIDGALIEIDEGIAEIDRQLEEAREQLEQAHSEYDEGKQQYEQSLAEAMSEFATLHEELEKAYAQLGEEEGYESLCNQFMLYFDPSADHDSLLKACESALGNEVMIKKSFIYENSGVKNRIDTNLAPIETMSTFMPMVFFVVILIVVFLFMSLVIRQCRREIGILRALGFTRGSIRLLYCGVDLVVSLLAIVLGILIGIGVLRYVGGYFRDYFPLPVFRYQLDWKRVLLAAALTIAVGQAATLIGTSVISKISPSEAMTRPAPVTAKVPKLIGALTKNSKPMVKFSVSTMLRNKVRFLFSVICVAASVMMIFSSLAFMTSKNRILYELYDQRINYGCQIFFDGQPDEETVRGFEGESWLSDVQPLLYFESKVEFGGRSENAVINALEKDTELVRVYDAEDQRLAIPDDGIVLEAHLAEKLGAKAGDTVKVDGVPFTVRSISQQSVSRFQYITAEQAEKLGKESLGCLILNVSEADEQKLLAKLSDTEGYLYCVFTRLSLEGNEKVFRTYDLAAMIIIVFAILIGLTIVYNTTQTNLLEKKKELCVLRTLGFQRSAISKSWFVQSLLQYLCSLAIGLPIGVFIAKEALRQLETPGREYVFANGPKEYVFTALLVFAYIVLSHILAMRSLKKWNIVETVKEKE